ncbi:unnamed protein product [Pelagomonas calceolata]|uniref:Uncharacterized protein n=1 Tax=Pelagomonas calceolata TaxID=35677 RepID=A0A8J2WTJ3_9STRA|nr:unnamed protein product [Pelagomonas calceolata]
MTFAFVRVRALRVTTLVLACARIHGLGVPLTWFTTHLGMAANAQRAVALDVPSSSQVSSVDEEEFEDASSDASSSYEELQNQAAARRNAVAEAFDVLLAVRATRAARSKVDGAGTGPPVRKHRFLIERTGALDTVTVLKVVTKTGELVPATSLCEFVQQAAAEQIEVYREFQRRGRIPLELPIDAPYNAAVGTFTGIEKGRRKWDAYVDSELRAFEDIYNDEYDNDRYACDGVPGDPTGRSLSFLVDTAAIATLAERQVSAGATELALGQALADDVLGHVLRFVGALPRNDDEAIAFLKYQCSTECGGTGADGTYLEVAESYTPDQTLYVEAVLFSTREGEFSRLEPRAELPTIPSPVYATMEGGDAPFRARHAFSRVIRIRIGPAEDYYTFAAAGASEPVVSLPSHELLRKNAEFERLKQRIRELMPGLAW